MNKSVTATHPSIWKLVNGLKQEDSLASFKVSQFRGGVVPEQRRCYRDLAKGLKKICEEYDSTNKLAYLRNLAHKIKFYR